MDEGEDESVVTLVATERPQRSLDELARIAREANAAMDANLVGALQQALICGGALLAARDLIYSDSSWRNWVMHEVGIAQSLCSRLMRLAFYKDHLPVEVFGPRADDRDRVLQPSANHAYSTYIRGLPPIRDFSHQHQDNVRAEALRLCGEGVPCTEVAEILGISRTAVYQWRNPDKANATRDRSRRRIKRDRVARQALEAQEKERANAKLAKEVGGELAKAYSTQRQALSSLSLSLDSTDNTTARQAIRNAITRGQQAEAEILDALRAVRGDS